MGQPLPHPLDGGPMVGLYSTLTTGAAAITEGGDQRARPFAAAHCGEATMKRFAPPLQVRDGTHTEVSAGIETPAGVRQGVLFVLLVKGVVGLTEEGLKAFDAGTRDCNVP
jgi:hypothetical protein